MQPIDLDLLRTLAEPTLSPDGTVAVVAVSGPDLAADAERGQLWAVPVDGSAPPRRLTRGRLDTAPAFSPDGRSLAFLRVVGEQDRPQLHVMPAGGGEPVVLTAAPLGAGAPRWSPDGTRIAWSARVPEAGRYGTDPDVDAGAEPPRHITTLQYRRDGVGFTGDKPAQVFVLEVPDSDDAPGGDLPEARQLTTGDTDAVDVAWSPDGTRLAYASATHEGRDGDLRADILIVRADADAADAADAAAAAADGAGEPVRVTPTTLEASHPAWSTDGATLWFLARDYGPAGLDFVARTQGLWSVPADGSAPPTRHTDPETDDLADVAPTPLAGDGALVHRLERGSVQLVRASESWFDVVASGPRVVLAHASAAGATVVTVADATSAGELHVLTADGSRRLTDFGGPLRERGVLPLHELTVTADDGYPVHGWVVLPAGVGPHPVLLTIHGGPYAQYSWGLFDEAQVYAAAGYAVVMCNPRGAAGYGFAHGAAIRQTMGQRDAADVLAFLDGALGDPALQLDSTRVGVQGGSYGGYLTAWLTTRTQRFAAAIVERGFLDPVSFVGSSDIGWFFGVQYVGDDPAAVARQSPMAHVDAVRTPTLVIHSEQDWRCPVEQGQRWYVALKRNGVDAELLLFPGEGHELSRSGRPKHRLARFEHVLAWWARHLPV